MKREFVAAAARLLPPDIQTQRASVSSPIGWHALEIIHTVCGPAAACGGLWPCTSLVTHRSGYVIAETTSNAAPRMASSLLKSKLIMFA